MQIQETLSKLWEKLTGWIEQIILMVPNAVIAIAVLIVFWMLARFVKHQSYKLLNRFLKSQEVSWLASMTLSLLVFLGGVVMALGAVGLDKTVTSLLAGAGIVGLALALAFQDLGQNVLAGVYLSLRRTIKSGDLIESNGVIGNIVRINLRATHIDNPQGQRVVVPNREIFQNVIVNYSTGERRIDLGVGVSYGDDLEKVKSITIAAVEKVPDRMPNRAVDLFFEEFGDSSINFVVRFWIPFKTQSDFFRAQSDAVMLIKKAYNDNDITIPFPIRTLDFGIVGGEKLSTVIEQTGLAKSRGLRGDT